MSAMQADEGARWVGPKSTVARALQDALRIIDDNVRRDGHISVPDYVKSMERAGVTVLAAHDTLRFLDGTGAIVFTEYGDISRAAQPIVDAVGT